VKLHRFEETIRGYTYQIEVFSITPERWRAYLVPTTDGPTALMPFYGRTPNEAVQHLVHWLSQAHRVATNPV